ncbi:MAG: hypothetical protein ABIJ39_03400, partial [Chloroflexota bacterium]
MSIQIIPIEEGHRMNPRNPHLKVIISAASLALALLLAFPVLADYPSSPLRDYLGPNRTVTIWNWERLVCHYLAVYDPPGPGYFACSLELYYPPSSSCPATGSVAGFFNPVSCVGWAENYCVTQGCAISLNSSIEGCSSGQTGCTSVSATITHPPATVSGSVGCAQPGVGGWCAGGAALGLSGSEPLTGYSILGIEGTRNGVDFACTGASCSVSLVEGLNDFNFWAHSTWGDTSLMGAASGRLDSVPPLVGGNVTGVPGDNGWFVSAVTVTAAASDATSGVVSLQYALNGGVWTGYTGALTLGNGVHSLQLRAVDAAGHIATASETARVDTLSPGLVLIGGGSFCPGCGDSLALNYSVSDDGSGVAGWQLTSGSLTLASGSGPATAGLGWDGGGLPAGSGSLRLEARDLAGNTSQETLGFTIIVPTPVPPTAVPPAGQTGGQEPVGVVPAPVLPSGAQSPAATAPPLVQQATGAALAPGPTQPEPVRPAVTVQFGDRLPLETF